MYYVIALCKFMSLFLISTEASKHLLHIGIFSKPENFIERLSIRRTWLRLIPDDHSTTYSFIIGNTTCQIPQKLRKNPYGCQARKLVTEPTVESSGKETDGNSEFTATGFSFIAENTISVTHLGISSCTTPKLISPIRVRLVDGYDNKLLSSVTFQGGGQQLKAIYPVTFPMLSEGALYIDIADDELKNIFTCCNLAFNVNGSLTFGGIRKGARTVLFDRTSKTCVYMVYKITALDNQSIETLDLPETTKDVFYSIEEEQRTFKDLMIVNITDFYRNLPKKLLAFIDIVYRLNEAEFALKTDDDSFVDILRVVAELKNVKPRNMWWWSYFKEYHFVPLSGKWREERYRSATYPPFPCGGGYIVNHRVLQYLAESAKDLAMFQGEDVSIGIWLAGTSIESHQPLVGNSPTYKAVMQGFSERACQWVCNNEHKEPMCNKVQLTVNAMYRLWEQYIQNGILK